MKLHDYLRAFRRNWIVVVVLAVLGVGAATAYSLTRTPLYESTAKVFVSTQSASSVQDLTLGTSFTQQVVQSYADVSVAPIVLDQVVAELGLDTDADELAERVEAAPVANTAVLEITATDEDAEVAAQIANSVGAQLNAVVATLTPGVADEASPIKITVIQEAKPAATPSIPKLWLELPIGGIGGIALAAIFAILREALDTRVRVARDIELVTDRPLIGRIARDAAAKKQPLVMKNDPRSPRAEAFRSLRTNLQFLDFGRGSRTMVITSSLEGEGKTTTAANLALTMADTGAKVVIIDADLRRPKLAEYLGIEGTIGLTDVLIGAVSLDDALQSWGDGLVILPAGSIPPNPSELLQGKAMVELLSALKKRFGTIVIDAPPLLPVSDAAILGRRTGGVIMVCAAGRARRHQLADALATLDQVEARVLGLVMTMVPTRGADANSHAYYGYARPAEEPSVRGRHMRTTTPVEA